ncbi:hypothetical protein KDW54_23095 [Burkholderia ambifaria]|nr:hypothetical protein [Burkholderia ambifaria]
MKSLLVRVDIAVAPLIAPPMAAANRPTPGSGTITGPPADTAKYVVGLDTSTAIVLIDDICCVSSSKGFDAHAPSIKLDTMIATEQRP